MFKYHLITIKKSISRSNKPIQNSFLIFLIGLLLLGLLSCSNSVITDPTSSTIENLPLAVTISTNKPLEVGNTEIVSFSFSEKITNFTPDDIQFLLNNDGVSVVKGNFITNNLQSYSLQVTPQATGTLYIKIPANSFEDLYNNKNTEAYVDSFTVLSSSTAIHTVSFILNGAILSNLQTPNLKVVDGETIDQNQLSQFLSYPPTGPQSNIQAVTRDVFEWRTSGTKYDFSTLVTSDLTIEAVWSNSCNAVESFHPKNKTELKEYIDQAIKANPSTNLNHINTSSITDMSQLFKNKRNFNGNIKCWNTSKVLRMDNMFASAQSFNQDVGKWNVSSVTNMSSMFSNTSVFNQDISKWIFNSVNNYNNIFTDSAMESYSGNYPPKFRPATISIHPKSSLIAGTTQTITFSFSKNVQEFTIDDIQFLPNGVRVTIGEFNTNNLQSYSLQVTPLSAGILYLKIPANSLRSVDNLIHNITTSFSFHVTDTNPPSISSIKSESLVKEKSSLLSFNFSENVTNFTPDDIQFLLNNDGVSVVKGNFITNNLQSYSLQVTPQATGTLYIKIPANSFADLYSNKNTEAYNTNFKVIPSSYTISFILNGAILSNPQTPNLKVVPGKPIDQNQLSQFLSYPPTGPQPDIQVVTRDIFEWKHNGATYNLSTPVNNHMILEAVWQNNCNTVESFHPKNKTELKKYIDQAITANPSTNLNHIDTSSITDMSQLFKNKRNFNGNIKCWNTSKVLRMDNMFASAQSFNQDVGKWNVSSVTNMSSMFQSARSFNQDISKWEVNSVTSHSQVFADSSIENYLDNYPPKFRPATISIHPKSSLIAGTTQTITFSFSKNVQEFTIDDIQFLPNGVRVTTGEFNTNSLKNYSLQVTPLSAGILYLKIPANSLRSVDNLIHNITTSFSFPVTDTNPPSISSIKSESLVKEKSSLLSFNFSENVTSFTPDDIQFLLNNDGVSVVKGNFITNNLQSYSLQVTPQATGTLYIKIPANSFADLYSNKNTEAYNTNFTVIPSFYTVSFILNGAILSNPQTPNLKVVPGKPIDQNQLSQFLSYPPTGPQPDIQVVTRDIFEWKHNGATYNLSTPVNNHMILEAVWQNNCNTVESFHPKNKTELKKYIDQAITANPSTNLNHIDTSSITDMSQLFKNKLNFNGNIKCWNTSKVLRMDNMFASAQSFNQDVGKWNVSSVTNMSSMFQSARSFNQDISKWEVNSVTSHSQVFADSSIENYLDNYPPKFRPATISIHPKPSLIAGTTQTITFSFSKNVQEFTIDDIQFLPNGVRVTTGEFNTNNLQSYSLQVTPLSAGILYLKIPANSLRSVDNLIHNITTSFSFPVTDTNPPSISSIKSESLVKEKSSLLSFNFSENVTNFTPDDIQFLLNNDGVSVVKGNFITNNLQSYSLQVTPQATGTLYIKIPANSFADLYSNKNTEAYNTNFKVISSSYTISFILNGAILSNPQTPNLKVVPGKPIDQNQLSQFLSYPPTGPQPDIQVVTRDIFEWKHNGATYNLSTPVNNHMILEAVWQNNCNTVESFHPKNKTELKKYIDQAITANPSTNLNHIDTSSITDMSQLFKNKLNFNGNIKCWNTSKVLRMDNMFASAQSFNQDVGKWNVSNVINMRNMFRSATSFNQDVGNWNVSNVINMQRMFRDATKFNQDISKWDVSSVTDMSWMFKNAAAFNQNLRGWSVGAVTSYNDIFIGSGMANEKTKHPKFH